MAVHFNLVEKLREFVEVRERDGRSGELDVSHINEAQRVMLFCVYLHAGRHLEPVQALGAPQALDGRAAAGDAGSGHQGGGRRADEVAVH